MPPLCPAAYARHAGDGPALVAAAALGGWPVPVIYCDGPGPVVAGSTGSALRQLQAAVSRGRHDGLLMPLPGILGSAPWLMTLLRSCTSHGVTVSFVLDSPVPGWPPGQDAAGLPCMSGACAMPVSADSDVGELLTM